MAYKVSDLYEKTIYSGDSDYDCKLFINGDRIPVDQISSIKISSPIIDTTEETGTIFHIGTFISQSITIKFRNLDGLDLTSNPSIYLEIGLKVGEEYEYVPIGEYIIDDLGENYQTSCEITCLDYAVKFKTNVDITQFFDENGEITASQLFEALCNYYGVGIGTYPTINNNKKIRFYDNTLSGKTYISYLAELFGGNAKMGRDGKLYIISLKPTEVKEYEGETIYIEKSMPVNAPFKLNGNEEQDGEPSPDYPSEVVTVGQNVQLFDKDNVENGYFYTNIKVANANWCNYETTELIAGQTYTTSGGRCIISFFNGDTNISYQDITDKTITIPENTNKVYISVPIESINTFKIEPGTVATPYSTYGQGSVEIEVCNENLFDVERSPDKLGQNAYYGLGGGLFSKIENGYSLPNRQNSIGFLFDNLEVGIDYTFSCEIVSNGELQFYFGVNNYINSLASNKKTSAATVNSTKKKVSLTFQASENNIIAFGTNIKAVVTDIVTQITNIKLERGATAKNYIQNQAQIKVLPIQQEMLEDDYIEDVEYHTWDKVVLTGNESWQWNVDNLQRVTMSVPNSINSPTRNIIYSNYFIYSQSSHNAGEGFIFNARLYLYYTANITSLEEWKAWLQEKYNSGNPVVVYYKLATPKSLPLTEEQKEVINGRIQFYEDITNITTDNNLAILNVKATTKVEPIEIDALTSKKFEVGDTYEITRVCYDNGITKFQAGGNVISVEELPTEEIYSNSYYYLTKDMKYYKYKEETQEWEIDPTIKNTLYIRQDNMFITTQEEIDNIYNLLKGFKIQNINCENRSDLSLDCWDMIKYTTDKGEYYTLNDNEITFSGVSMGKVITNIPTGTKAETTNIIEGSNEQKIRKVQTQINEVEGTLKIVAEETTQIKGQTDENTTNINNNYNEILQKLEGYATEDDIITVNNKVETIQSSTDFAINVIEDIQVNGVNKVKTTTGYTFDENGLEVSKTGAETKSVLNEKGLNVKDNTGSSEESLLFAGYDEEIGETIVKSKNMTVQKYLVIGKYSRVEDYHEGTGVFWIGGN